MNEEDDRDDESDYEIYEDWLGEQKVPSVEEDWYDLYGVSPRSRRVPEVGG